MELQRRAAPGHQMMDGDGSGRGAWQARKASESEAFHEPRPESYEQTNHIQVKEGVGLILLPSCFWIPELCRWHIIAKRPSLDLWPINRL